MFVMIVWVVGEKKFSPTVITAITNRKIAKPERNESITKPAAYTRPPTPLQNIDVRLLFINVRMGICRSTTRSPLRAYMYPTSITGRFFKSNMYKTRVEPLCLKTKPIATPIRVNAMNTLFLKAFLMIFFSTGFLSLVFLGIMYVSWTLT